MNGWPTIYVLDHEGVIRFKNVRGDSMDEALETLLAEMGHENALADPEPKGEPDGEVEAEANAET